MPEIAVPFLFVFGLCAGSFLNVCICRIPAGQSILRPRSRCVQCGYPIPWYQNLPVVSWVLLLGRCAGCGSPISVRYPLVEILTGFLFVAVVWRLGFYPWSAIYLLFGAALITLTFIDLDHQIIPDVISLPGIAVGVLCSFAVPWLSLLDSVLGVCLGGGCLLVVAWGYAKLRGVEGMGGGDIKLLAMIGAFMGYKAILPVIFLSSVAGTVIGVPLMLLHKGDGPFRLPFGPFLSAAALVWLLWGGTLWQWYLSLIF